MGTDEAEGPIFSRNLQQEPQVLEISVLDSQCFLLVRAQPLSTFRLTAQPLHGLPELLLASCLVVETKFYSLGWQLGWTRMHGN